MAQAAGLGVSVDLDSVNVAFDDMLPEVISCSETQERFLLAVPSDRSDEVTAIFNEHFELPHLYQGAGAFVIGHITPDKRFRIAHHGETVCDADVDVITTGIVYERSAQRRPRNLPTAGLSHSDGAGGVKEALVTLLASENVSDKAVVYQHYDSEVQGRAVLRPGEADAAVEVFIPGRPEGLATSCGGSSRLGAADPYLGGVWSVLEAARNVACVGATPIAFTDCLNFGDPEDPGVFWEFTEAVRGIGDACRALRLFEDADHGVPVVSGNVSFYNQSQTGEPIAPTPIVACAGRIDDASRARNMGFKAAHSRVVMLGRIHDRLAGSEYERLFGGDGSGAPEPDLETEVALVRSLVEAFSTATVTAAHDVSHGGLLVTVAEMMLASAPRLVGCRLELEGVADKTAELFAELGGVVVEVAEESWPRFRSIVEGWDLPYEMLGRTSEDTALDVRLARGRFELSFADIRLAHQGNIASMLLG
jgi:phosphoribosylformylglycinamidine synthase